LIIIARGITDGDREEQAEEEVTRVKRFPIPNCDDVVVGVLKIIYAGGLEKSQVDGEDDEQIQNRSTPYIPTTPKS